MARFFGLIIGFFLPVALLFVVLPAAAVKYEPTQQAAFDACMADVATWVGPGSCRYQGDGTVGGILSCPSRLGMSNTGYEEIWDNGGDSGYMYSWCVPADCSKYNSGDKVFSVGYETGDIDCDNGCMGVFTMSNPISVCFPDSGECYSLGSFQGNGNRCSIEADASLFGHSQSSPPPDPCDAGRVSCYDPGHGFCGHTESGETVCVPAPPPGGGGCGVGATGSVCAGNGVDPPAPSDPPIGKGSPPQASSHASGSDTSGGGGSGGGGGGGGGGSSNWTIDQYSGTSPGPGPTSSSSPPSSGGGTGSGSNANGSGNSGDKGTDDKGQCPDGKVPTASGCSGTYTDQGCDTPPQCYGDAVLCGIAKEGHYTRCATQKLAAASGASSGGYGDVGDALAGAGVPADGGASGDPSTSGLVSSADIGEDGFDSVGLGFSRTCPANPTFSVLGHDYTFDLAPFCNFAGLLGWFVLLVAYLSGLRIVATGKA